MYYWTQPTNRKYYSHSNEFIAKYEEDGRLAGYTSKQAFIAPGNKIIQDILNGEVDYLDELVAFEKKLKKEIDFFVDLLVVRKKPYRPKEVFRILWDLHTSGEFRSCFIGADWNDPRKGKEFPQGQYIGLKQKISGETWKFDIWFIPEKELERVKEKDISNIPLTPKQRQTILQFKQYRKDQKLKISGQEIYDLVLKKEIIRVQEFEKEISHVRLKKNDQPCGSVFTRNVSPKTIV